MKERFYIHRIRFDENIAAAGEASKQIKVDSGSDFIIEAISFEAHIVGMLGSSVVGTPLLREAHGNSAYNQVPSLSLVDLSVNVDDFSLSNGTVSAANFTGEGSKPFYLPTQQRVRGGQLVKVTCANGTAVAIQGELCLIGRKVPSK